MPELGLINMGGRVYNARTNQFISPDPYRQAPDSWLNCNRFGYCMGNPVMYTDPNGEYFGIDDVIAMLIGGIVNSVSQCISGNVHNVGQFFSYFGVGAAGAEVSLYASPVVGGMIIGGGNAALDGAFSGNGVSFESVMTGIALGGITSYVGGQISGWVSNATSSLMENVVSPALRTITPQAISGAASGFLVSTGFSLLNGADFKTALSQGWKDALFGFTLGTCRGLHNLKQYSDAHPDVNPWTGKATLDLSKFGINSTQKGLNPDIVDDYYNQMADGSFNASDRPIAGYKYNNEYYITDGHHRMAAAYRIYVETGNKYFIDQLIKYGSFDNNNPATYGYYKTRLFK